jgi:hypothetical protein
MSETSTLRTTTVGQIIADGPAAIGNLLTAFSTIAGAPLVVCGERADELVRELLEDDNVGRSVMLLQRHENPDGSRSILALIREKMTAEPVASLRAIAIDLESFSAVSVQKPPGSRDVPSFFHFKTLQMSVTCLVWLSKHVPSWTERTEELMEAKQKVLCASQDLATLLSIDPELEHLIQPEETELAAAIAYLLTALGGALLMTVYNIGMLLWRIHDWQDEIAGYFTAERLASLRDDEFNLRDDWLRFTASESGNSAAGLAAMLRAEQLPSNLSLKGLISERKRLLASLRATASQGPFGPLLHTMQRAEMVVRLLHEASVAEVIPDCTLGGMLTGMPVSRLNIQKLFDQLASSQPIEKVSLRPQSRVGLDSDVSGTSH